jgi:WD40 repeat protein
MHVPCRFLDEQTIRVFDVLSGELLRTLRGHTHMVACLCLHKPLCPLTRLVGTETAADLVLVVSGGHDKTVRLWCKVGTQLGSSDRSYRLHMTQPIKGYNHERLLPRSRPSSIF